MALSLKREMARTCPDRVVYVPKSMDGSTGDTGNEHFLVFRGPSSGLMAVWTQSSYEDRPDIVPLPDGRLFCVMRPTTESCSGIRIANSFSWDGRFYGEIFK